MTEFIFKSQMTSGELNDFFKNWVDNLDIKIGQKLNNTQIEISVHKSEKSTITVLSKGIVLGEFIPDNGCVWGDKGIYAYYPIIKFNNQLNNRGREVISNSANTTIEVDKQVGLVVNEEKLLKCVRNSYSYFEIF